MKISKIECFVLLDAKLVQASPNRGIGASRGSFTNLHLHRIYSPATGGLTASARIVR
jgi:hypothetical protein